MPRWARLAASISERLTATVLVVQGWCPHCGRGLDQVHGGREFGMVAGHCAEHGAVDRALTA